MRLLSCLFLFLTVPKLFAADLKLEIIITGQQIIWAFDFLSPTEIIFTERQGALRVYSRKDKKTSVLKGLPKIHTGGQAGLLDVIADSDFSSNQTIFLTYSKEVKDNFTTAVFKAQINRKTNIIKGQDIFVAQTDSDNSVHYGSRIREAKDTNLFVSVGDRGERHEAQKLGNHHGKILRITKAGKAAPGNPFLKQKDALPEIWSYGHRNPQGMDYDSVKNELWINEHGPRGGDEINLAKAGRNYGWPIITYGKEYWGPSIGEGETKAGIEPPLYQYTPSIAPSGLTLYQGEMFKEWQGNFISGALKLAHLNRLYKSKGAWKEDRIAIVEQLKQRIRSVKEAPDGSIYFSTDSGDLYRLYR